MNALVVYESLWGNTAAIAHAIGEGIGEGTLVRHTGEIEPADAATAQLLVVGAPVHAFSLPSAATKKSVAERRLAPGDLEPDLSQPPLKTWLDGLSLIHISEPTRRTPISYAVFCLKKNK